MIDASGLHAACTSAVALADRRGRPVLMTWQEPLPVDDEPIALWQRFRVRSDRTFFWASPWSGRQVAAAGSMLDLAGHGPGRFRQVRHAWAALSSGRVGTGSVSPSLVGGFSFRPAAAAERPAAMPDALLWLPTVSVIRERKDAPTQLTLNAVARPNGDPGAMTEELRSFADRMFGECSETSARGEAARPGSTAVEEFPSRGSWMDLVTRAVAQIRAGSFEKVVLARRVEVRLDTTFDLDLALHRLVAGSPDTTTFAAGMHGSYFLGATPEYLVQVADGEVRTLGLAGSKPRGATPGDDAAIGQLLRSDVKENHEHEVVTRELAKVLSEHCDDVRVEPGPSILRLPQVQHLCTRLTARPRHNALLELVEALHPTPALGGHPSESALRWLTANEPLDRGWYAAPIGWIDSEGQGEFAVGIRSASITGRTASVYAGCGVVGDSDPASEYRETQAKLGGMLAALGVTDGHAQPVGDGGGDSASRPQPALRPLLVQSRPRAA